MKCMCNKRGVRQSDLPQTASVLSVYRAISCFNKHVFLARVLPRQFSVYLSCDSLRLVHAIQDQPVLLLTFFMPPVYHCKLLLPYISYNFLYIGLLLFVLSTHGVLCISFACNIPIQCLLLHLSFYLSLAYVSHVYRCLYR